MRRRIPFDSSAETAHLFSRTEDDRPTFWTEALAEPPAVYGERVQSVGDRILRRWEPGRSKLGAALAKGWTDPIPQDGERWLYLGASSGTTASHVADLTGPGGTVYAVEPSLRPFARLRELAGRYPNLLPIRGDARRPLDYVGDVPAVDGLYVDVAQPDQVDLAIENARLFLRGTGLLLLVLKTASMGRDRTPRLHLEATREQLDSFEVEAEMDLSPFHRRHYLLAARPTRRLFQGEAAGASGVSRPSVPRAARRR